MVERCSPGALVKRRIERDPCWSDIRSFISERTGEMADRALPQAHTRYARATQKSFMGWNVPGIVLASGLPEAFGLRPGTWPQSENLSVFYRSSSLSGPLQVDRTEEEKDLTSKHLAFLTSKRLSGEPEEGPRSNSCSGLIPAELALGQTISAVTLLVSFLTSAWCADIRNRLAHKPALVSVPGHCGRGTGAPGSTIRVKLDWLSPSVRKSLVSCSEWPRLSRSLLLLGQILRQPCESPDRQSSPSGSPEAVSPVRTASIFGNLRET